MHKEPYVNAFRLEKSETEHNTTIGMIWLLRKHPQKPSVL
jgi:hypothetical protein